MSEQAIDLLREWMTWWERSDAPAKMPAALHVRTATLLVLHDMQSGGAPSVQVNQEKKRIIATSKVLPPLVTPEVLEYTIKDVRDLVHGYAHAASMKVRGVDIQIEVRGTGYEA